MKACQNIAVAHFHENAEPLPVTESRILDETGRTTLAMCSVPSGG
jgi:hypothetical protein